MTIGRAAAAVTGGDGRESATDVVLTAVRQYEPAVRQRPVTRFVHALGSSFRVSYDHSCRE
ncbi:hypothetical protein E2L06_07605 [Haloterrigena sp. H1]|nr:hypothetical protein E2L06_07605 [Haloterrigena sp. H1]